ncbi:MAG TPA: PIN domain-containing protein [Burkholderiaceae bacterium]|nr:PIN domain-containing protein [Burkholderiaceae bacterium]
MQGYLLDTCVWSHIIRRTPEPVLLRFSQLKPAQIHLSPVVLGELTVGFYKGDRSATRRRVIDQIVAHTQALVIDSDIAERYALIRATLEQAGTPIGRNDTWIAAEALVHDLTLVTDNLREFERVPGLKVESWL